MLSLSQAMQRLLGRAPARGAYESLVTRPSTAHASPPTATIDFKELFENIPTLFEIDHPEEEVAKVLTTLFSTHFQATVRISSQRGNFYDFGTFADGLVLALSQTENGIGQLPKEIKFGPEFDHPWIKQDTQELTGRLSQAFDGLKVSVEQAVKPDNTSPLNHFFKGFGS